MIILLHSIILLLSLSPHISLALSSSWKINHDDTVQLFAQTATSSSFAEKKCYDEPLELIPVSRDPIMLLSSRPLLTLEECDVLANYFLQRNNDNIAAGTTTTTAEAGGNEENAKQLLQRVQNQIDDLTGFPTHDGDLIRYVVYDPNDATQQVGGEFQLLPDGLHVDSNNGKYFRQMTILLYLSTNDCGATIFPLARPLQHSSSSSSAVLEEAAQELIRSGITHTRNTEQGPKSQSCSRILDQAAISLIKQQQQDTATPISNRASAGIRVFPVAGRACVFYNLLDKHADPMSFHGGEALLGGGGPCKNEKRLLTFFKEIPIHQFQSPEEFISIVQTNREYLLNRYFCTG